MNIKFSDETLKFIRTELVDRFVRYTSLGTQSKEDSETIPSTPEQWELARMLEKELRELGLKDVRVSDKCYVYATIPAKGGKEFESLPALGFIAHIDTSPAVPGKFVKPIVHDYKGGDIKLPGIPQLSITVDKNPRLKDAVGSKVISSDGTTLLGADDKAGVTEIMTMAKFLTSNDTFSHGPVKICFTPDEEVGMGHAGFEIEQWGAFAAYTVDGEREGELNEETFNASAATIVFKGKNVHPGFAKGIMINSQYAVCRFVSLLQNYPRPEITEGREGYIHPYSLSGTEEVSTVKILLRDFEKSGIESKKKIIQELADKVKGEFPEVQIEVSTKDSYQNMYEILKSYPFLVDFAEKAMKASDVHPIKLPIRGGTDGARLSFKGLPCPNLFCGSENVHGKTEWISLRSMEKAVQTIVNLVQIWAENREQIKDLAKKKN
ncbi:MAG: peptidase T [Candidatus Riflebacteria bacterium]|nr:peptidase T [Candidatus Riflebacteria bacterium]